MLDIHSNIMDKQAEAEKRSKVYSTEKIDEIIKTGDKDRNPFWHGNVNFRDADIVFEYTEHELEELEKCASDPIYFIENYCKFLNDKGRTLVKLRDY